jgi:hypothetical protein
MDTIGGLPAHPLVVHAVVVLVPLSALGALVVALWPRARSRFGWLVVGAAVLDVVLVPWATSSGESLEEGVRETALMEKHAEMGGQLTPWVVVLAVGVLGLMLLPRLAGALVRQGSPPGTPWLGLAVAALTVVAAGGALVQVVRIGHSGAEATWSGVPTSGG